MTAEYSEYFSMLDTLTQQLEELEQLQHKKIQAVREHDLDVLNDCMKQEQAVSLALRGLEQKRETLSRQLGLEKFTLSKVPEGMPPEERTLAQQRVEQLLRLWDRTHSAQQAARTVVEGDLRRVNQQLEKKGIDPQIEEGYHDHAGPGIPPKGLRTDFRA